MTVSATGDDDIAYVWSITNGNTDEDGDNSLPFAINSGTGATVNDADDLDFETTSTTADGPGDRRRHPDRHRGHHDHDLERAITVTTPGDHLGDPPPTQRS